MMKTGREWRKCVRFLFSLTICVASVLAQGVVNVPTRSYNNQRTGANLSETILTSSNVNSSQFGKLFTLPVDDQVYAQILYVSALSIAGGTHNVIFVATANNSVYAFDADTLGPPLWQRNFNGIGVPSTNLELGQACTPAYTNFVGNIGIVSTPAIDLSTLTMVFLTRTVENGATVQRLRAINITTGADQENSPQVIQASVAGTGDGGTTVVFNPLTQNQRSALSISQGIVYIAWASYCDTHPYHGWVMAYNESTLAQVGVFNATPNGESAGIWMAGAGLAFDASGSVYFGTGNGTTDDVTCYGESLMKLSASSLGQLDYFTASNQAALNSNDEDFGSSGPSMLPGTTLLTSGGKEGRLYLLNTTGLGHQVSGDSQIPQVFQAVNTTVRPSATHHIHNNSPSWNSPEGLNVYVWGENDYLHGYRFNTSKQMLTTTPFASGSILPPQGMPGGMMTISANGSTSGTGVLWASVPRNGDASEVVASGNLYAFNAETLALLWASTGVGDDTYNFSKGSIPMVANGKVYLGSDSALVNVYGNRTVVPPSQNLALNKIATGSTPCTASQGPAEAVNGSYSEGLNDKFCSAVSNAWLEVDLGAPTTVSRFIVEHAGAGGETLADNSAAFNIQVSTDNVNFTTVVNVTNNTLSITTHDITPVIARYVRLNVNTPSSDGDPATRIYEFQVFNAATAAAGYSLSATPGSQSVTAGTAASYTVTATALNNFDSSVTFSALGAPAGSTVTFSPTSVTGSGSSMMTVSTSSATAAGAYTLTITGTSGALQQTATVSLTVSAAGGSGNSGGVVSVPLSSAYDGIGFVTDGSTFHGGIDGFGWAYSANLLGTTQSFNGATFTLGPPNVMNVVSNATVALPAGQYTTLNLLATGVNGNQVSQTFTVTYTDTTTSTFTQSLSDWYSPEMYAGESNVLDMAYRDHNNGTEAVATFHVYGYSFALNPNKTVSSITLPANSNVVVLAMTLVSSQVPVSLSSAYNVVGIVTDGSTFHGGLDGFGWAYSANLMGATQTFNGSTFNIGTPNVANVVTNATVALPTGQYATLNLLATGVNGNQVSQIFTVTYMDGTTSTFTQSLSDWYSPEMYPGEYNVLDMAYRDHNNGTEAVATFHVYGYSFALNPTKTVSSITLPANTNVAVLAMTLIP